MDLTVAVDAPHPADAVFAWVAELDRYPAWLEIVPKAVRDDSDDSWLVYLRGRLGPLARSKRLRMVRTAFDDAADVRHVRFERAELDGREHAAWVLDAEVVASPDGLASTLTMRLHYGGGLFGPVIERLLTDEIAGSRARLLEVLAT